MSGAKAETAAQKWWVRRGHSAFSDIWEGDTLVVRVEGPDHAERAALIAAAPEMYQALKALTEDIQATFGGVYRGLDEKLAAARAALAKADGQ